MKKKMVSLLLCLVMMATVVSVVVPVNVNSGDSGLVAYWNFDEGSSDIAYDFSTNNNYGIIHGTSWTDHTLSLDHGVIPDASIHVYDPSVIKEEDTYKMWWSAFDGSHRRIYYSTSTDGVTWTDYTLAIDYGEVPDALIGASYPSVIKDGDTYKMWWTSSDGTNMAIYYSTSIDGIEWSGHTLAINHGDVPDASTHAWTPSVIKDGDTYKMWWTATDENNMAIFYSTSMDGITWIGHTLAIDHGIIPDASNHAYGPSVLKDGSIYKMWWGARDTNWHIYYSTSSDGIDWSGHTLAINHGDVPDALAHAWLPSVIKDGDAHKMWWTAGDGTNYHIYYSINQGPQWGYGISDKALMFDGDNDYVEVSDSSSLHVTDAITIELWLKVSSYPWNANRLIYKDFTPASPSWSQVLLFGDPVGVTGSIHFRPNNDNVALKSGTKIVPLDDWTYIVCTYDSTLPEAKIYINGELVAQIDTITGPIPTGSSSLEIGKSGYLTQYYDGLIDEMAIWNKALNAEEIAQHYNYMIGIIDIKDIIEDINEMDLPVGVENSLISILGAAINSLENGNGIAGINQLEAFINLVEAFRNNKLTDDEADALIGAAQAIIDYLSGE